MIRIYNFRAPSRAMRPIWLCEEMGLRYDVEYLGFPTGADYRARYALGSVPFLEDDGVAIPESIAMLFYLAQNYGPTPLLPDSRDPQLARVLAMAVFSEATFGAALSPLFAARFLAPEGEKVNWTTKFMEGRCETVVDYVADFLGKGPYIAGDRFTVADIAISGSLGMWTALGKTLPETLGSYQAQLERRPAQQRALKRARGE